MRLLKLGGIFFLIISTFCVLVSCEEENVNLTCGPYLEDHNLLEADSTSSLIFNQSNINLINCYTNSNYNYEITQGNKYVFSYYFYYQEGPDDNLFFENLLFEVPADVTEFYIDDNFCDNKVIYSAAAAFSFTHLYEGPPGCISGNKFEMNTSEGLKVGYDVNINIPTFNEHDTIHQYVQFSKKFYLAEGAAD